MYLKVKRAVNLQCGRKVQVGPAVLGSRGPPKKVTDWPLVISRVAPIMIQFCFFGLVYTDYGFSFESLYK